MKEKKGIAISDVLITHELKYQMSHTVYTITGSVKPFKICIFRILALHFEKLT